MIPLDKINKSQKKKSKKKLQNSQEKPKKLIVTSYLPIAGLNVNRTNYPTKDTKCQVG